MLLDFVKATSEEKVYTVLSASDGMESVNMYESHTETIALVIKDMGLPKMSGEEEFFRIKKNKSCGKNNSCE